MKAEALVLGAGGHARVVAAALRALGIHVVGFLDEGFAGDDETIHGAAVLGTPQDLGRFAPDRCDAYLAIGDNAARARMAGSLRDAGFTLPALVHPTACVELDARVSEAACVCLGARVGAQARIGRGVIVNTGACVDHESQVHDFAHLAPGVVLAGRVRVGEGAFVGIGARVAEKLSIGRGAVVGAGSVVLKDVPDGARVLGVHH